MPRITNPFLERPRGFMALLFRAPVNLYRVRLGLLFGSRFLLLVHRGRKTGRVRQNVLEVMDRNGDEYIVMSGWGPGSQWYRNIQANPALEVRVGRRRFTPSVRFLSEDEAADSLGAYATEHPVLMKVLDKAFAWNHDGTPEDRKRIVADRPMVGLRPIDS
jgi:deazaflavin-dependent oxidoreductase (nitroreductase family)